MRGESTAPIVQGSPRRFSFGIKQVAAILFTSIALLLIGLCAFRLVVGTPYSGRKPIPWTREAWLAAETECEQGDRYMMLDDLLATHQLMGMTLADVEQLLGPIDHDQGDRPPGGRYCLGPRPSGMSLDFAWLALGFDADNRVNFVGTPPKRWP
jgi:hypothetical protein